MASNSAAQNEIAIVLKYYSSIDITKSVW